MPYPQRTSGGGGGARVPTLISNTDFADIAALEAFASANANLLLNNADAFSTAFVATDLYHYQGAEGVYVVGQWTDATPEGLTPEMTAAINSVINLPQGAVPQGGGGTLSDSGMDSEADRFSTSKSMQTGLGSFFLEDAFAIESSGRTLTVRSVPDPTSVFRLLVAEPSNIPRVLLDRPDETFVFQPNDADNITNPNNTVTIAVFDTDNPEDGQYVKAVTLRIDPSSVLTNWTIAISIDGTLFQDYFFPTVSPSGPNNEFVFNYLPPIDVLIGDSFNVQITSPDGDVVVKGDSATGVPYQSVDLALTDIKQLALMEDIDHPVTLRRDMPSADDSLALANVSLNDNSALWIAANNQVTSGGPYNGHSNRSEASIRALQPGFLDLDGNEIPTTATTANTIELRGGTIVRVFGQNDFRVVNSPVFESDITNAGEMNVQANWSETDTNDDSFIQNKPTIPTARTDEEIRDVVGSTLVAGMNVSIDVDDDANTVTISSTSSGGGTPPPADADRIYYGLSQSDDTTTIDVTTLTRENSPTNPDTISTGTTASGDRFVIYVPMTHDLASIFDTILQQDVTTIFTSLDNAQVVDTIPFKSYIIGPLNAGVNEQYVINF